MNKGLYFVTGMLLAYSSVEGWGSSYRTHIVDEKTEKLSQPQNFPYNVDQGWFTDVNYLLWKPSLEDADTVTKVANSSATTAIDDIVSIKVKDFDYGWNSGVRFGIGKFLPNHDQWDISAFMTYFYGSASGKSNSTNPLTFPAVGPGQDVLFTSFTPINVVQGIADKNSSHWRLNYFVWDLMIGRAFEMTPRIVFHPYIGLRAAAIYQDINAKNRMDWVSADLTSSLTVNSRVSLVDHFWGVGARVGSNFNFNFTKHFSLLGNLAGSLLYGHHKVKENDSVVSGTTGTELTIDAFTGSVNSRDKYNDIYTNLDGSLGFGWEWWCSDNTIRIAPAFMYEGSIWFDMNSFYDLSNTFTRNHGNLGFMGFTFDLQIDF